MWLVSNVDTAACNCSMMINPEVAEKDSKSTTPDVSAEDLMLLCTPTIPSLFNVVLLPVLSLNVIITQK